MELMPPCKKKKQYLKAIMKQPPAGPSWPGLTWAWPVLLGSLTIAAAQWMAVVYCVTATVSYRWTCTLHVTKQPSHLVQFYLSALPNPGGSWRDDAALWKIIFCRVTTDGAVCFGTYGIQHHHSKLHQDSDRGEKSTLFSNWYSYDLLGWHTGPSTVFWLGVNQERFWFGKCRKKRHP